MVVWPTPMKTLILPTLLVICLAASPALAGSSEPAALSLAPSLAAAMADEGSGLAPIAAWLAILTLVITAVCVAFRAGRRLVARAAIRRCP